MLDVEPVILEELRALSPSAPDDVGDWDAILAAAGPRRRDRRRLAVAAAALALIALLATPAFGLQGYLLQLLGRRNVSFQQSPSAPNVVKKQFLDLPLGAPGAFTPRVEAGRARTVATFRVAGRPRKLWVAPTRAGGYCYTFELSFGGCRATSADRRPSGHVLGVTWNGPPPRAHLNETIVTRVAGDLTAPAAARIGVRFADGSTADIPFVWVSAPIAAGFFSYDVPTAHWTRAGRLVSVTLYAGNGRQLDRQTFPFLAHPHPLRLPVPPSSRSYRPRVLPASPPLPPSKPAQTGRADGYAVVVGRNGAAQFRRVGNTPILGELAGRGVDYSCARLTHEFGILTVRGLGESGLIAPRAGFLLQGVGTPVDLCEISSSIGHTWPDRLHDHAAVEIPLTRKGRAFFADRAAARDVALFVRSKRMHALRREPAARARRDIERVYGRALATSALRIEVPDASTLRVSERSSTGKVFSVTIHDGRIARKNLEPYAFVF